MPNRLAQETSPYLQQHAGNPVDWYPWGAEALSAARDQDKPILLSIGYSACHWCHVMAHESFEDHEVAALMNKLFINVKVDREERPDLDQIYQSAHALLSQRSGGWPLTMFLMPDQTPFFSGTYFPKTARQGMPGFVDILPQIADAYHSKRSEIDQQNEALRTALANKEPSSPVRRELTAVRLEQALRELKRIFDEKDGGIGRAPKFPHPAEFEFCLQRGAALKDDQAMRIVRLTFSKMAEGGIYDQLGGGFCRYSTDEHWTIPHFEKMLYDNGPLLRLYSDLWLTDPQPLYARTAADTAQWVMREMQAPDEGGYYSSLDADSEHVEGKFYVWTPAEVKSVLSADEYAVVEPHYGLDAPPNFEATHWHLRVVKPLAVVARRLGLTLQRSQELLDSARTKLFESREQRVHPGRDEKILVSWNALMAKGMARAARVFNKPEWLASARRAIEFIRATLWRVDGDATAQRGRLLATYKDGRAHLNAYLDDYAYMLDALLELMQHDFRAADLDWARAIADVLLDQFEDRAQGGFFFVSHDHERLIHRVKTGYDNATPSGNGVAALALNRLGHLIGQSRYIDAAQRAVNAFRPALESQPSAHASLCAALEELLVSPTIVVLRGDMGAVETWQREVNKRYFPHLLMLAIPAAVTQLPATLQKPATTEVNAWVCHGVTCLPPITDLRVLLDVLASPVAIG